MARRIHTPEIQGFLFIAYEVFWVCFTAAFGAAVVAAWVMSTDVSVWSYVNLVFGGLGCTAAYMRLRWRLSRKERAVLYRALNRHARRWPDMQALDTDDGVTLICHRKHLRGFTRCGPEDIALPQIDEVGTMLLRRYSTDPTMPGQINRHVEACPLRINDDDEVEPYWDDSLDAYPGRRPPIRKFFSALRFARKHGLDEADDDELRILVADLERAVPRAKD